MNKSQKQVLEPIAIVLGGIAADLSGKEDEEIIEMYEACEAATTTDCWCWIYQAAQYMRPVLLAQMKERRITPSTANLPVSSSEFPCSACDGYDYHFPDCPLLAND